MKNNRSLTLLKIPSYILAGISLLTISIFVLELKSLFLIIPAFFYFIDLFIWKENRFLMEVRVGVIILHFFAIVSLILLSFTVFKQDSLWLLIPLGIFILGKIIKYREKNPGDTCNKICKT